MRWAWAVLVPLLVSLGAPEPPSWTGKVAVKGNEPFAFLALVDASGHQWRLSGTPVSDLWAQAQGRWVRVLGQPVGKDGILVESWAWSPEQESK